MADAARQIRHDLAALEKAISALGKEFDQIYDSYLGLLRTSIQTQVVLACYHLCTRTYPDRFLELSYRQRESFQQALQHHIHQTQQKLMHAYILATVRLFEEEEEVIRPRRQRSLPAAERGSRRSGRDFRSSRDVDDAPSDDGGPSIEFIAITGIDGEDAMEAAKDPFLAAALAEFADNLALDEQAILKRVKQELLRKAAKSSKNAERLSAFPDANDANDMTDASRSGDGDGNSKGDEEDNSKGDEEDNSITDADAPDNQAKKASEDNPTDNPPSQTRQKGDDDDSNLDLGQMEATHQESEGSDSGETDDARAIQSISEENEAKSIDSSDTPSDTSNDTPETAKVLDNPDGKRFSSCDELLTPDLLSIRQEQLETNLAGLLRDLSKQVNHELHQVGMIPKKIPGAVLKAALKADVSSEAISGPPNVLNLLVEAEGKSQDSKVMRVTALRLRPPELEFSDPQLSACRSRIRELTGKLQKLGKDYHKKQEERAIAEAESAWRSSWYERGT